MLGLLNHTENACYIIVVVHLLYHVPGFIDCLFQDRPPHRCVKAAQLRGYCLWCVLKSFYEHIQSLVQVYLKNPVLQIIGVPSESLIY